MVEAHPLVAEAMASDSELEISFITQLDAKRKYASSSQAHLHFITLIDLQNSMKFYVLNFRSLDVHRLPVDFPLHILPISVITLTFVRKEKGELQGMQAQAKTVASGFVEQQKEKEKMLTLSAEEKARIEEEKRRKAEEEERRRQEEAERRRQEEERRRELERQEKAFFLFFFFLSQLPFLLMIAVLTI
jgi:F0F1-type ATP synthase epsilon subunit